MHHFRTEPLKCFAQHPQVPSRVRTLQFLTGRRSGNHSTSDLPPSCAALSSVAEPKARSFKLSHTQPVVPSLCAFASARK
jgi:hypothetical protein